MPSLFQPMKSGRTVTFFCVFSNIVLMLDFVSLHPLQMLQAHYISENLAFFLKAKY